MTSSSEDAIAIDRFLEASPPAVAEIARALRLTVPESMPEANEWFDPGKRIRHVKVRSVEDAGAAWLRIAIAAQIAHRVPGGQ